MNELQNILAFDINKDVYIVGLAIGSLMVITACIVYFKNGAIKLGGLVFSFIGAILIGMSVWSNIEFSVGDLSARLNKAEKQVNKTMDVAIAAKQETEKTAQKVAEVKQETALALKSSKLSLEEAKRVRTSLGNFQVKPNLNILEIKRIQKLDLKRLDKQLGELER